ncbi:MAG: zf-HC2 domain-containing protein [Armatimonadetes bacterium]|nr:zf-HC2 domain-containing protein [Armatimonadota bacterium]MBS1712324.1 zf-HC2 domain-containing protein [Armatimonadota bacterium]MBX3108032.1 zf-HC2 domain-containing protein [Fimbriimonadaceae bacterium]
MNSCYRCKSLLSAYLDRELGGEEMIALRDHMAQCPECALEFEELRAVKAALIRVPQVEPSEDLLSRIQSEVFTDSAPVPVSKTRVAAGLGMAAAIAFLMFAVLGWVEAQRQSQAIQQGQIPVAGASPVVAGVDQGEGPAIRPAILVNASE